MEIPSGFCDVSVFLRAAVYVLVWKDEVVYVGQSTKPAARIATHISQKGKQRPATTRKLPAMRFDRIWVKTCALSDLDRIEKELIEKYQPRHNIKRKPVPTMSLDMLVDLMPVPMLPPAPEPRQFASWRRL